MFALLVYPEPTSNIVYVGYRKSQGVVFLVEVQSQNEDDRPINNQNARL